MNKGFLTKRSWRSKHRGLEKRRRGVNLVDLIAVLAMASIVFTLTLVGLQRQRAVARGTSCQNNLRNIGIAILQYHEVHSQLPIHGAGSHDEASADADEGNAGPNGIGGKGGGQTGKSLSLLVGLLPHLDQQDLWEIISQPSSQTVAGELAAGATWNAMGPATSQRNYPPWVKDLPIFACPSDPRENKTTGRTNYAACLGDALDFQMDSAVRFNKASKTWKRDSLAGKRVDAAARGAFVFREAMKFSDITDGLSNTMLVGEILTDQGDRDSRTAPALGLGAQTMQVPVQGGIFDSPREGFQYIDPYRPRFWHNANNRAAPKLPSRPDEFRGMRWADAHTVFTGVCGILPPNLILQVAGDDIRGPAVATTSSNHSGGANILLADGSTTFISDSIDCGNISGGTVRLGMEAPLAPGSPSPFSVWGALSTRSMDDND